MAFWGRFNWCSVRLEGGGEGIFGVLWGFDVCTGRFRGCWGHSDCFGGVWNVMLGAFWGCWGHFGGCWGQFWGVLDADR